MLSKESRSRARQTALTFLLASVFTTLATVSSASQSAPPGWPECRPEQIRIMLVGTYHMANPGLDAIKREVDDVRSAPRQTQILDLVERLARFQPHKIATETAWQASDQLNSKYRDYLEGEKQLSRDETEQLGFRLAGKMAHDKIYAIDFPIRRLGNDSLSLFYEKNPEALRKNEPIWEQGERRAAEDDRKLAGSTVVEFLRWINSEPALRSEPNKGMFAHLAAGEEDNYGGADLLTRWYERNLKMAHHLFRIAEPGDQRILLIVGAGHVTVLRHLLDESPHFCPVSPLPYLE